MSDVYSEVVAMLDDLRDKAHAATRGVCHEWTRAAVRHIARNCDIDCEYLDCSHGPDDDVPTWSRYDDAPHIVAWSPAAVLALVGDDGDLRKRAQRDLDGLREHDRVIYDERGRVFCLCGRSYHPCDDTRRYLDDLTSLRDTLRAMRDAT